MTDGLPQWIRDLAVQVHSMIERHNLFARFQDELRVWSSKLPSDVAFEDGPKPIDLLPFPNRELTLPEQYAILAAIHDEGWKGKKINPWPDPFPEKIQEGDSLVSWKEGIPYMVLRANVRDVPQSDTPYIEDALTAIERDLDGTDGPIANGFRYAGDNHDGLIAKPWLLVNHLWKQDGRTCDFEDLAEPVWGDREHGITNPMVSSLRTNANKFFLNEGIPFEVSINARIVSLLALQ